MYPQTGFATSPLPSEAACPLLHKEKPLEWFVDNLPVICTPKTRFKPAPARLMLVCQTKMHGEILTSINKIFFFALRYI
jgi:hypothetical protein